MAFMCPLQHFPCGNAVSGNSSLCWKSVVAAASRPVRLPQERFLRSEKLECRQQCFARLRSKISRFGSPIFLCSRCWSVALPCGSRSCGGIASCLRRDTRCSASLNSGRPGITEGDEVDLERPSDGFSSVAEAVEAIRQGKFVIAVDDEDRENEGDLIIAGSLVTPEAVSFMVQHGSGIICAAMKAEDLNRLKLPLMVDSKENEDSFRTAFTITVDVRKGTTTGISASDRAKTILALASPHSKAEEFRSPGYILPLRYQEGGVLKRTGHTEASVDLTTLAGVAQVGVVCELVNPVDGSMCRLPQLREFANKYNIHLISVADLVRYRRNREKLVERTAVARLPTRWGVFEAFSYTSKLDGYEHVAMVKGAMGDGEDVLVRVHSECLTGDIFGSARCDCGNQLAMGLQAIQEEGRGVLVYLRGQEGRGIGLGHKLLAYNLQDQGRDTVEANVELGLPVDSREYGIGAQILRDVGVRTMKLMTNNPAKFVGLRGYGLAITRRVPLMAVITQENERYLETKRSKMGHIYGSDLPGFFPDTS